MFDIALNAALGPFRTTRRWQRSVRRSAGGLAVLLLAVVLAVTGQASFVRSASQAVPELQAASGTGTGGAFNPLLTRVGDTRNGVGGYSTPLPAGSWRSFPISGVGGIPGSGVASVVITITALTAGAVGNVAAAPNTSLPASPATFLLYNTGETVSNTGIVDVGTDGKIALKANNSVDVLIDVQGYFTVGNGAPAPGGYVSADSTRIVNTQTGVGGVSGQLALGSTTTFTAVGGSTGIPATATAIYANITISNSSSGGNYVTPYATGTTRPGTSLNFPGAPTAGVADATALGATIDLNSSGQFNLYVGPSGGAGPVDVFVDVQGYFDGEPSTSGFTPLNARILDTRVSPAVPLAANAVTTVQVGGVGGVPAGSDSLAAVALNVQVIPGAAGGYLRIWPGDEAEPTSTSTINFEASTRTSNLALVQPAVTDGTIKIRNTTGAQVDLVLDAEGYLTNPSVLPQAIGTNVTASGSRAAAAMIKHSLTDRSGVQINPTNGNLLYTQALLNVTGIGLSNSVGLRYNSLNDARPTLSTGLFEAQLYRNGTTGAVTYTAPDGAGYVFTPTGSSYTGGTNAAGVAATLYTYDTPAGINATLVRVGSTYGPGTEYDLTFHPGQTMNVYADNGSNITLNSSQDVTNNNKITYTYANSGKGALTKITDTQGRTVTFGYGSSDNTTQPSTITDNSLGRTITLTYGGGDGELSKIVDATGAQTLFGYDPTSKKLSSVTDGRGNVTSFSYGTGNKLGIMTAAAGSTTTTPSTWTLTYPSSTSTKMADPNSHSNTYAYNSSKQVTGITDARGHAQTASYNVHNDVVSSKTALNDTTSYDIGTSTYNLTKITSPAVTPGGNDGRTQNATYTSAPSGPGGSYTTVDYRPNTVTDADTNMTTYAYNKFGEAKSVKSAGTGTGAAGTRLYTYWGDEQTQVASCAGKTGQLCKATDGKGNVTSYVYNSAGNLATMTPPAPLGARTFSYDAAGRKITEVDGRGNTSYTCYDKNDRITQVSYTSATCSTASGVTYTYDTAGNLTSRVTAATGDTVTWAYDAQNRPKSQTDPNGNTSVTYDKASNVLTFTDSAAVKTTTYTYDDTNNVSTLAEPGGSCPTGAITPNSTKCTLFGYDDNNKRLTTALPNGVTNTVTYDHSGRQNTINAAKGATVTVDRTYYYDNSGADSGLLRTMLDTVSNKTTTYTYDQVNRLSGDTVKTSGTATVVGSDSYLYDLNGNMTKQVTGGTTTYYGYNAADQMCWTATTSGSSCTTPTGGTSFTYDENGNTLTGDATTGTNTWTNYDQLATVTVGGARSYGYEGTSNVQRSNAGNVTFTTSVLGQVSSDTGGAADRSYIRDPDGTLIALQTGGASYYYTLDNIGSVVQLTSSTGTAAAAYTYNPYGKTVSSSGSIAATNTYRYASGYTDGTGLIKFGARYYNPTLARFTQPDPSGQESNRYAYTGDAPVSRTDVSGLDFWDVAGAVLVGGIAAAVTGGIALGVGATAVAAGAIGGAAAGAAGGATLSAADDIDNTGEVDGGDVGDSSFFGVVGAVVGAVAGAIE